MAPQAGEQSETSSGGTSTPQPDDAMARALQMMAESLSLMNQKDPPIYAPQLPPYSAENMPVFDGNNVTAFIERYEDIVRYYNFTDSMKIDRLTAHCKPRQRAIIQASEEYSEVVDKGSWRIFREGL